MRVPRLFRVLPIMSEFVPEILNEISFGDAFTWKKASPARLRR